PAADAEVPDKVVPSAAESKVGELETKKKTSPGGLSLADALSLASVALQSAAVVRPIPAAPAPASLTGVESAGDQPFTEVDGLLAGLKSSGPPPRPGTDLRLVSTLPIFATGLGTFGYEYTKQYLDTLLIDRAGSFLDTGLDRLTKGSGLSKVLKGKYVVGPLYTIARAWYSGKRGLDDPHFWMEFAGNAEGWGTVGKSAERFGKRWDRIFFGDGSLGDRLAESFGLVADGVEVLRDVLDAIAGMFGNLSALFCVLGIMFCVMAVAFSFFLFLAWLSPFFFSLANAMFALGELLGALNSFLSLLSLLTLTPLVTLIRSYSTLIVPADRYNEEASLLQDAVNNHAQKSAAYRADRSAKDHRQAQAEHGQASELAKQGLGQAPPSDLGNRGWKKFLTLDHYRPDLIQNFNNIRSDMAESRKTIGGFSRSNQQGRAQSEEHDANAKTMEDAQKALDRQHALEVEILRKDISVERRKILEGELARMGYARNRLSKKEKVDRAHLAAEMQVIQQKLAEIPRFKKLAKQTEALRKQLLSESEVTQHKRTVTEMRVLLSA
ncbi:MAG TPA: hypothetical protein PLA94_25515, partial [Myxococcota bacterium]|nr:hypothetical protein [Myxococcota bacterium]